MITGNGEMKISPFSCEAQDHKYIMPSRALPNLGLKAFFIPGEDGWGDDVSQNFLKLSTLVQAGVVNIVTSLPGAPNQGDVYILGPSATSNPNKIAIYDSNVWNYLTPLEGWIVFNRGTDALQIFDGNDWKSLPLSRLVALSARDIGVTSSTSLLDRASADARYSSSVATVTSFNTRTGPITLTQADVIATGFTGAVSSFNGRTGAVTLQATDASVFTLKNISDVPSSYTGKGGMFLRVKSTQDGMEFASADSANVYFLNADTTLNATHAGSFIRLNAATSKTLTIPAASTYEYPLGTKIHISQVGMGSVKIDGASGVQIDAKDGFKKETALKFGVITLMNYGLDSWQLYGDLRAAPAQDASNSELSGDSDVLSADNG